MRVASHRAILSTGENHAGRGRRWPERLTVPPPVPALDYRLCILTNGRPVLRETLEAFRERVSPQPTEVVLFDDGGDALPWGGGTPWSHVPYFHEASREPLGFCRAVPELWRRAVSGAPPLIFWLEDDILIRRPIQLEPVVAVLVRERRLAQMAFMRQPVNSAEIEAGGCRELRWDLYEEQPEGWLRSRTNFSTGCSLLTRRFMREQPWPVEYDRNCEGRYSIDLLGLGYEFGVWGLGESWVEHVGRREGFGY